MKKNLIIVFSFFWCLAQFVATSQTPFKNDNIVVSRIGNGVNPLASSTQLVFLDEFSSLGGAPIQSLQLPDASVGANHMLTLNGTNIGVGNLTLSPDKQFLSIAGYDAAAGTGNSASLLAPKSIGIIDFNGIVNTSTTLTNVFGRPNSAIINGNDIWCNFSDLPISYITKGSNTYTNISSSSIFSRVGIYNGQLFSSTQAGTIASIGTGLPTTGPQSETYLSGIVGGGLSQFVFADMDPGTPGADVLYVSNQGNPALTKYSLVGTTWISNGTIGAATDFYNAIAVKLSGNVAAIYAIRNTTPTSTSGGGELVTLTDNTGYNPGPNTFTGIPTVLATAPINTTFRGVSLAPQPLSVSLSIKAFLQGAYNLGLGRHKNITTTWASVLNASALNQPYNVAPFNYTGTESVSAGFFTSDDGVETDVVDWVLVELHDATTPSTIIARKACFIREDGKIVDLDKTSNPSFTGVGANNYYVVIKHRNHLPIRSATTVFVNGATPVTYDFTTAQSQAYQNPAVVSNAAMKDFSGVFCMWGGNVNANNNTKYTGPQNDALSLLALLGANQAAILSNVYSGGDVNMDGSVRYTGPNNDALALLAVLSANQAAVVTEHQ